MGMTLGVKRQYDSGQTIVIKRGDVERVENYARDHRDLRDYLLIRLPKRIGLRTHEIATLSIEDINFEDRSFQVLDSKKHRFYPLPLDPLTLQLIKDLIGDRSEGVVFQHKTYKRKNQGKPLTNVTIWKLIKTIGEEAGVKGFHPRILRHYFAADWYYVQEKSIEGLRRILRHKKPGITLHYVGQLVFFEDIEAEYHEIRVGPFIEQPSRDLNPVPLKSQNYLKWCSRCDNEPVCKFVEEFCTSKFAANCKYFVLKEEIKQKATITKALRNSQDNKVSRFQSA